MPSAERCLVISWVKAPLAGAGGGKSWLRNHFSACICIMCDPLRRCRGRFSSPFIWYISGTERRRLTRHNISNQITCDQSNVVIVLGPYSFPSNECKSTPSLRRQWQQLHGGRRSVPPRHFADNFFPSPPFLRHKLFLATDSFGVVIVQAKPWSCAVTGMLANEGRKQAVSQSDQREWNGGIPALHSVSKCGS